MSDINISIEEIKGLDMVEFLSYHYGMSFSRCGSQYNCLSPFTIEKEASFFVGLVDKHWLFKDFSSGYGGSLIDFVLIKEGFSEVSQALAYIRGLIAHSHDRLELGHLAGPPSRCTSVESKRTVLGYDLNYLYSKLQRNDNLICRQYLNRRGISPGLIDKLCATGMLLHNRYRGRSYCCFAVFNAKGQLCCLDNHQIGGRKKFVLGHKAIFSLDFDILSNVEEVFVCEGIIDYLSLKILEKNRLPGIALLGNVFSSDTEIFRAARKIISAFDNDAAGIHGFLELKKTFPTRHFRVYNFSNCKDANEYLQKVKLRANNRVKHPKNPDKLSGTRDKNFITVKKTAETTTNIKDNISKSSVSWRLHGRTAPMN